MIPFDQMIFVAGFSLACGWYAFRFLGQLLVSLLAVCLPKDNSDGETRSGFTIKTDALTGVQYLLTRQGHVVVRVDSAGYPVVTKK